jgi:hypothetical protein
VTNGCDKWLRLAFRTAKCEVAGGRAEEINEGAESVEKGENA